VVQIEKLQRRRDVLGLIASTRFAASTTHTACPRAASRGLKCHLPWSRKTTETTCGDFSFNSPWPKPYVFISHNMSSRLIYAGIVVTFPEVAYDVRG